jgi:uncharacterized protein (TIRG00374 family)
VKKILKNTLKIILPLLIAGGILFYMYRDFDFTEASRVFNEMNAWWLLATLIPITLSHVMRGLRWLITLEPLGYRPKAADSIDSIFIAYASNIVIPRVGEVSRCAVLTKYDGIPFSKALGTLVAERLVDMLLVLLFVCIVLLTQMNVFASFFAETGTNEGNLVNLFTNSKTYLIIIGIVAILTALWLILRKTAFYAKMMKQLRNFLDGLLSLRTMHRKGLFLFYTVGIWICYLLEFYLAFYCFPFTAELGIVKAIVIFAAISLAIVIPTPNGAGPWHFVVISMMTLYGVSTTDASAFALLYMPSKHSV